MTAGGALLDSLLTALPGLLDLYVEGKQAEADARVLGALQQKDLETFLGHARNSVALGRAINHLKLNREMVVQSIDARRGLSEEDKVTLKEKILPILDQILAQLRARRNAITKHSQ